MKDTVSFSVPGSMTLHELPLGSTMARFLEFDLDYFEQQCVESYKKGRRAGGDALEKSLALKEYLRNCHPYCAALLKTDFAHIALDCIIDHICQTEGVGLEELWVRYVASEEIYERAVFERITDYKSGWAINQWSNLVRMRAYAASKAAVIYGDEEGDGAVHRARSLYYDMSFRVAAMKLGFDSAELPQLRVYSLPLMPEAPAIMKNAVNTLEAVMKPMLSELNKREPIKGHECVRDLMAGMALSALRTIRRPDELELRQFIQMYRTMPETVYEPGGLKAIIDLEFDQLMEKGFYLRPAEKSYVREKYGTKKTTAVEQAKSSPEGKMKVGKDTADKREMRLENVVATEVSFSSSVVEQAVREPESLTSEMLTPGETKQEKPTPEEKQIEPTAQEQRQEKPRIQAPPFPKLPEREPQAERIAAAPSTTAAERLSTGPAKSVISKQPTVNESLMMNTSVGQSPVSEQPEATRIPPLPPPPSGAMVGSGSASVQSSTTASTFLPPLPPTPWSAAAPPQTSAGTERRSRGRPKGPARPTSPQTVSALEEAKSTLKTISVPVAEPEPKINVPTGPKPGKLSNGGAAVDGRVKKGAEKVELIIFMAEDPNRKQTTSRTLQEINTRCNLVWTTMNVRKGWSITTEETALWFKYLTKLRYGIGTGELEPAALDRFLDATLEVFKILPENA